MADEVDVRLGQLFGQARELFTADELRELAPTMPRNRQARVDWLQNEIVRRQTRNRVDLENLRENPSFQESVLREQLGKPVDISQEALTFGGAIRAQASSLVGYILSSIRGGHYRPSGGAMDVEGELADARELFPGRDIQVAMVPDGPDFKPLVMVEGDEGQYVPFNRPGPSKADAGQMVGDLFSLETVGSLLPYMGGIGGRLLWRAFKSGLGAATGAAGDEVANAAQEAGLGNLPDADDAEARVMANIAMRGGFGFAAGFAGEAVGAALGGIGRFATGYAATPRSTLERKVLERALEVQGLGAPIYAGQATPASFLARLRSRWSQLDTALREQVLGQKVWLGERAETVAEQFLAMDGVEQALYIGGMDLRTMEGLERELGRRLAAQADTALGNPGASTVSRQKAGEDVQEALLDPSNKEQLSYRKLGNALLEDLENKLLDIADDAPVFSLNTQGVQRVARDALSRMPIPQTQAGRASEVLETGEQLLGVGIEEVAKKYSADLRFVLRTLANLPEDGLLSKGTYQVRTTPDGSLNTSPYMVDGNGNIRTSYETVESAGTQVGYVGNAGFAAPGGNDVAQGPVIGTYEANGVEVLRMMRSKLRDFFGNPLVPVKDSEAQLAKKLYLQIGEILGTSGDETFNTAVTQYNKISSRFLGQMDRMKTAGFAQQGAGQKLVTQVTSGAMGFQDALLLKRSLDRTGERGQAAWQQFRKAAVNDFIRNPEKISNLDIEPKTARLFFDDADQAALREYASQVETLQRQGPVAVARRATGVRGTALALVRTIPDNALFDATFQQLSPTNQNIMRFAVVEDLLQRSVTPAEKGVGHVFNPQAYVRNYQAMLAGDSGERLRRIMPPEALRELGEVDKIAAFYSDVLGLGDTGASIAASETAGAVAPDAGTLGQGLGTGLGKMAQGTLDVLIIKGLSASLAEGMLGRIFAPRLREAPTAATQAQAMVVLLATAANADARAAESKMEQELREGAERARLAALRQQRGAQ